MPTPIRELVERARREIEVAGLAWKTTFAYQVRPLIRVLGDLRASQLDREAIEAYKAIRIEEGAARGTVNNELACLGRSIQALADRIQICRFELRNARQGFIYPSEFARIIEHLPELVADIAIWAYWTGWRKGEILSLIWDLIQDGICRVRDKNGSSKLAVLEGPLRAVSERRRLARLEGCPLVFHRQGGRILGFRKAWNTAVRKSGLGRRILFHDLRRSFINNGRQAGVDRKVLMEMSGHKTHSVFDRYNIVDEREHREAARRIMGLDD